MSYLLSFSLLEAITNDKPHIKNRVQRRPIRMHSAFAGGSLVGESILSRYDRRLI
jgi:hypothetical protein